MVRTHHGQSSACGERGLPNSYRLNSPQYFILVPEGGLREFLKECSEAHLGVTPIRAHCGGFQSGPLIQARSGNKVILTYVNIIAEADALNFFYIKLGISYMNSYIFHV